ncbi:MAG: protein kinase domain-containing protein [Aureliella sp.]
MSFTPATDGDDTFGLPENIGRYRIQSSLGSGGFGVVYLAVDEKLDRRVAIKVPHPELVKNDSNPARIYLEEARMVATLDHPHIVPVYDIGANDDFACYVVSKYISGQDLRKTLAERKLSLDESIHLVATIAQALHHAHKRGIVHRDVKPGNILLNRKGDAFVADFGLALPERRLWKGPQYAGTPAYMSPEQARGEGHRVDGRSDIFSLGAVFYECLTGRKAFKGGTKSELLEMVEHFDPRPVRLYDETLPKELDRICQKAMAKRASERYQVAQDLAEELLEFGEKLAKRESVSTVLNVDSLKHDAKKAADHSRTRTDSVGSKTSSSREEANDTPPQLFDSTSAGPLRIVPKGLRSFDAHDADFFVELLPGPRDRDGLPENLRSWKSRCETFDSDETFSVGMIFGPSGCGKSSFVRAGLVPRLSDRVRPIVFDATNDFTEEKLRKEIQKLCPSLDEELDLCQALSTIRRGGGLPSDQKLLIVIDQFERWLHSQPIETATPLVRALRQCDGERLQTLLLVRSDFWMAITRFLGELEIECLQGKNFEAIDLLPLRHAEKTLIAFGRSLGALPESELSTEQTQFIQQSVSDLAEDNKVICVRLALYAEMMKNLPWTLSSLKQTGGTEGVGLTYLEESFGSNANPNVRLHQKAARGVLAELLPESGTLSVQLKSYQDLMRSSGYTDVKMFDDLIRMLDAEMRLISPTDPSGVLDSETTDIGQADLDPTEKYYRLSHDYLLGPLRKWLQRKQRESYRGRAQLLLTERTALWETKPDRRYLPSMVEHARIRMFTRPKDWTGSQSSMLKATLLRHLLTITVAGFVVVGIILAGFRLKKAQDKAVGSRIVAALPQMNTEVVAASLEDMAPYRDQTLPLLIEQFQNSPTGSTSKLHAAMALQGDAPDYLDYIFEQLPNLSATKIAAVCNFLNGSKVSVPNEYARLIQDDSLDDTSRLRAACVLAHFDSGAAVFQNEAIQTFLASQLTELFPSELLPIRKLLLPIAASLSPKLRAIYEDKSRSEEGRSYASESWVYFNQDAAEKLCDFLLVCDARQFPLVMQALEGNRELQAKLASQVLSSPAKSDDLIRQDIQTANAAIVLFRLGNEDLVWPLLKFSSSPQVRSYIIHWFYSKGCSVEPLLARLESEENEGIANSIMLALGEFPSSSFSNDQSRALAAYLEPRITDDSASTMSTAIWLQNRLFPSDGNTDSSESPTLRSEGFLAWLRQLEEDSNGVAASRYESTATTVSPFGEFASKLNADTEYGAGPITDAIHFDGSKLIDLDRLRLPDVSSGISISCWIRLQPVLQYSAVWSSMDPSQNFQGIDLWLEPSRVAAHVKHSYYGPNDEKNQLLKVISEPILDQSWQHVTVTYDGKVSENGLQIYLNGELVPTTAVETSLEQPVKLTKPLTLGGRRGDQFADLRFNGDLSGVAVFARHLNATEALAVYRKQILEIAKQETPSVTQQRLLESVYRRSTPGDAQQENSRRPYDAELDDLLLAKRDWYWTHNRHRMIRLSADSFRMGSNSGYVHESEFTQQIRNSQHERKIERVYALSSHEVSIGQFQQLMRENEVSPDTMNKLAGSNTANPNWPISMLNWFECVQYCNWLSASEGIPEDQWCYVPHEVDGYAIGMTVKPKFWELTGYRLPTQAEWEYACRAGTSSRRYYGYSDDLLNKYAWYLFSDASAAGQPLPKPRPVGSLKPNDWGFFDMQGNAMEWCFDLHDDYPYDQASSKDHPAGTGVVDNADRELRGSAYYDLPQYLRSAYRFFNQPSGQLATGFRVCRTLRDDSEPE